MNDALDRGHERAAKTRQERADDEHAGIDPADIGAQRAQHLAIERRGTLSESVPLALRIASVSTSMAT